MSPVDEREAGRLLGVSLDRGEVRPVAGIGELVEHGHAGAVAAGEDLAHQLAADEPGATGDQEMRVGCELARHRPSGWAGGGVSVPASASVSATTAARTSDATVPASAHWPS